MRLVQRFVLVWGGVTIALACAACGSDEGGGSGGGPSGGVGGGAAGSGSAAGSGGAAGSNAGVGGTTAGAAGTAGIAGTAGAELPMRPPNPRDDIGPADGVHCEGEDFDAAPLECAEGEQCCPSGVIDGENQCGEPGAVCHNCTSADCASVLCDGPEDCPGELCCIVRSSCSAVGAPCFGTYFSVECRDDCSNAVGAVVCKDPHDCLFTEAACVPNDANPRVSECR